MDTKHGLPPDFADKTYREAARSLFADDATSFALRKRIAEDEKRDPVDALNDAELLHALQSKRLSEAPAAAGGDHAGDELQRAGVEALRRLYTIAQGDTGQCRYVARFLLGLYNGERFPFDLTDLRAIDDTLFDDCMRLLRMDARACKQEVHLYFQDGGKRWEQMAEDWGVPEVGRLKGIAREVIERDLFRYASDEYKAELVKDLKLALRYRDTRDEG